MSGTDSAAAAGSGPRPVLILNTGSSTFKWALLSDDEKFVGTGSEAWEGADSLTRKTQIVARLHSLPPCRAVGHRVVHGGTEFRDSVLVDDGIRQRFEALLPLDPLHMRPSLCALDAARDQRKALQAVLDIEASLGIRSRAWAGGAGELDLDAARAEIVARLAVWAAAR